MLPSEKWILSAERAAADSLVSYFNWFDKTESLDKMRSQACVDFFGKILTPDVLARVGDPSSQSVLEIGSGGGRLLGCAAQVFDRAVGVDLVYDRPRLAAITRELLTSWGVHERTALVRPADISALPSESFGFVYSFIVFQHLDSEEVALGYLQEVRRLLTRSGSARIFVGRAQHADVQLTPTSDFDPDNLYFHSTLQVSETALRSLAARAGLRVLAFKPETPKQPWSTMASSQSMVDLAVQ
jgi:SAM-dependent methyltransferase